MTGSVMHADDPVGRSPPRLVVQRPPRWAGPVLPIVSFWPTRESLLSALGVPPGRRCLGDGQL